MAFLETKGLLGKGVIREPIDAYLVPNINYVEWWATQTYRPLIGPVEAKVYFYFSFCFLIINFLLVFFFNLTQFLFAHVRRELVLGTSSRLNPKRSRLQLPRLRREGKGRPQVKGPHLMLYWG